jgi:tRNA(adenine34) deaminase
MAELEGESREAANNFLGAEFWQPGTSVAGTVLSKFESANGLCYGLQLATPVRLQGQETSEVALGNLTGLRMALQAAGVDELLVGDAIELECTGLQPTNKGNDRIDFKIHIDRPDRSVRSDGRPRNRESSMEDSRRDPDIDIRRMSLAIERARAGFRTTGGAEVGAVVAVNGQVVAAAFNEGELQHGPTGYAEMVALRRACDRLKTTSLKGSILYCRLQPSGMCTMACVWAGVESSSAPAGKMCTPSIETRHSTTMDLHLRRVSQRPARRRRRVAPRVRVVIPEAR